MLMKRADNTYTYTTKKGTFTDYVRGVPLSELLAGSKDKDVVTFGTADNYINFDANGMTVGDLIKNDYILAYEKGESKETLKGIYEASKDDASVSGCFVLYGNGASPVKLVNSIEITGTSGLISRSVHSSILQTAESKTRMDRITLTELREQP